jgi:hypothetical protein
MQWHKLGLIFAPPQLPWMASHAALPFALDMGGRLRVYFSGRDMQSRARIGYFEVELARPRDILALSEKPALDLGALGTFDDRGVTSSWVVRDGEEISHFYTGWNIGVTVPFYFYIGLARSRDGGKSFERVSAAPILGRNDVDPLLTASPCVILENGLWRMWYVSGSKWEARPGEVRHYYHIKYAESKDGIRWEREGLVCIDYQDSDEYAIARPCVLKVSNGYRMWYCYRGPHYKIGYAESADGIHWQRKDGRAGIDTSAGEWDSEMVAYPFVFRHNGGTYMLYNGNGYGRTGIGLAELKGELH